MTTKRKPWTKDRKRLLRRLWDDGLSDEEIAARLKRTPRAIAIQRSKQGCVERKLSRPSKAIRNYATGTMLFELRRRGYSVALRKRA